MAIVYLATFIIGAASGAIHPAFYAYIGAALPLLTAFIYLYTCTLFPHFGAATTLNGFIIVLFLIVGEADAAFIIGMVVVTVLTEIIRKMKGYDTLKGVRWSFVPFAFSFFAYTAHWWTDTDNSLAAAVDRGDARGLRPVDAYRHQQYSHAGCRLSCDHSRRAIGNTNCYTCT